jgi:hypothetical protein
MIPFLLTNIMALVVFLACSVALYPDGDHAEGNQKKNIRQAHSSHPKSTQDHLYHLPPQVADLFPHPQPVVVQALSPRQQVQQLGPEDIQ